ncbi:MAG: hypothetical protein ABJ308_09725 [Halieaceae bacterium]
MPNQKQSLITKLCAAIALTSILISCNNYAARPSAKTPEPDPQWNQYAIKFVCGKPLPADGILNRGRYFTAINIHNPELERPVDFFFKVAVAEPGLVTGDISGFQNVVIIQDGALEIDCPTILKTAGRPPVGGFLKGFVVVISKEELDIVGVYTAGPEPAQVDEVHALHMERVPTRPIDDPREQLPKEEACIGEGCCCNSPRSESNPALGNWPDCTTGFTCKSMRPGGVLHPSGTGRIDVNVCVPDGAGLLHVPFIRSTEPSFCRVDVP